MVFTALSYFSGWVGGWLGGWVAGWVGGWVAGLVENIATSAPTKVGVWAWAELGNNEIIRMLSEV